MSNVKCQMSNVGFTLIEMLVVIAVIGVLAVAVFVAINPVEQMNKAKDGGKVSTAKEIIDAAERYYVVNNSNPPTGAAGVATLTVTAELKAGGNYSGLTIASCVSGTCKVTFMPASGAYSTKCAGACTVPDNFGL